MAASSSASSSVRGEGRADASSSVRDEGRGDGNFGILKRWAVRINYMCLDILKMGGQTTEDDQAELAKVDSNNTKEVFDTAGKILNHFGSCGAKVPGNPTVRKDFIFRWLWLENAAGVLSQGNSFLNDYSLDEKPRQPTVMGDSCLTFNLENKHALSDGAGMAKAYSERQGTWKDKTLPIIVLTKDAAKQDQMLTILTTFISTFSIEGNPEDFKDHAVFVFSPNDIKKGNKELHDYTLKIPRIIRDLLRRFPLGTVTILTPGTAKNFGYSDDKNFDFLAEYYTQVYVDSGHPVFNPSFIYDTMEPNFYKAAVREGEGKNKVHLKNEDGSLKFVFSQDEHFLVCPRNYDIMCSMITRLVCVTQTLGCLSYIARAVDFPFTFTTPNSNPKLRPVTQNASFFPESSGLGSRHCSVGDLLPLSGAKVLAGKTFHVGLGEIPEATNEEALAHNLRFPWCPVYGDMMVANGGYTASGHVMTKPRGYILSDDGTLEVVCDFEYKSTFGPVLEVKTNSILGDGKVLSVLVPLPNRVPGAADDDGVWVQLNSGHNVLATLRCLDLPGTLSETCSEADSSSLMDFGNLDDTDIESMAGSAAPSSVPPSMAGSALAQFYEMVTSGAKALAPSGSATGGVWDEETPEDNVPDVPPAVRDAGPSQADLAETEMLAKTAVTQAILQRAATENLATAKGKAKGKGKRWGPPPSGPPPRPPPPPLPTRVPAGFDLPKVPANYPDMSGQIPKQPSGDVAALFLKVCLRRHRSRLQYFLPNQNCIPMCQILLLLL